MKKIVNIAPSLLVPAAIGSLVKHRWRASARRVYYSNSGAISFVYFAECRRYWFSNRGTDGPCTRSTHARCPFECRFTVIYKPMCCSRIGVGTLRHQDRDTCTDRYGGILRQIVNRMLWPELRWRVNESASALVHGSQSPVDTSCVSGPYVLFKSV